MQRQLRLARRRFEAEAKKVRAQLDKTKAELVEKETHQLREKEKANKTLEKLCLRHKGSVEELEVVRSKQAERLRNCRAELKLGKSKVETADYRIEALKKEGKEAEKKKEEARKEAVELAEKAKEAELSGLGERLHESKQNEQHSLEELRRLQAPGGHAWEKLTDGGARWARKTDMDYLNFVFTVREWRASDVASALLKADLLNGVFISSEIWPLRIGWMNEVLDRMQREYWDAAVTASISVAMNLSTRNIDELRNLTGKRYDNELDKYDSVELVTHLAQA
eukprot:6207938-Pleurochrysis_carterae.AAC.2